MTVNGLGVLTKGLYIVLFLLISLFILGIVTKISKSSEQIEKCKQLGGIPQTERGKYQNCAKPENFIDIGESK